MLENPLSATPSILQVGFGAWGQNMPDDGMNYCGPTAIVMGLYWLSANGFTQLAPAAYVPGDPAAANLELVIAGLTSASAYNGVDFVNHGVETYLALRGISPTDYQLKTSYYPTPSWLAEELAPNTLSTPENDQIVLPFLSVTWYYLDAQNALTASGSHCLTPLAVSTQNNQMTLNNPWPNAVTDPTAVIQQSVVFGKVPTGSKWASDPQNHPPARARTISGEYLADSATLALMDYSAMWKIPLSAAAAAGHVPSPWLLEKPIWIDTNGAELCASAPITGPGGINKAGEGLLCLLNDNDTQGPNQVLCGQLGSTSSCPTPFGTGGMSVNAATLLLKPESNADLRIASGSGSVMSFGYGGTLQLAGDSEFTVTIGGNTDGTTPNLQRHEQGTLLIDLGATVASPGPPRKVIVNGTSGNTPPVSNGMVSPYILGVTTDADAVGSFLTYDSTAGFQAATTTNSGNVSINNLSGTTTIYDVVDQQTIVIDTPIQVAALSIEGVILDCGGKTLTVGTGSAGDVAGVLLSAGSTITDGTLSVGAAEALIYCGGPSTATISAQITGSGGLTTFGQGMLTLAAADNAVQGAINVNSGTLSIAAGGRISGKALSVRSGACIDVEGTVDVSVVYVDQAAVLQLAGGTITNDVTTRPVGDWTSLPGGILEGFGTIAGAARIEGPIQSGAQAGEIVFYQRSVLSRAVAFSWRLQQLVDDTTALSSPAWNTLHFPQGVIIEDPGITFLLDFSVLGSQPEKCTTDWYSFWSSSHTWSLFRVGSISHPAASGDGNFVYDCGTFTIAWKKVKFHWLLQLVWTPDPTVTCP